MAYVLPLSASGSTLNVGGFRQPGGPQPLKTAQLTAAIVEAQVFECDVSFSLFGTYVQGTGFEITMAQIASAIAAVRRDGATYTVQAAMATGAGLEGTGNPASPGVVMPGALTLSAGNITGLLYLSDGATEHPAQAMLSFVEPITISVVVWSQTPGI